MPKVSVLVPVYNVEKYLSECLESLVNQTLQDIEIICINDGSTDNSPKILEDYQEKYPQIKVINKENSGYGATMNLGLKVATGEYIGIVESDDFVKPEMFEDLYNLAAKQDADIVKSDFYFYITEKKRARKAGKIDKTKCGKIFNIETDCKILKIMPSIWSSIYKKDFLVESGINFLETAGASYQDTSFAFKALATAKRIIFTDEAYLFYRQDNEKSSVNSKSKVYAICDEWEEITRFLNEKPEVKEVANQIKLALQYNAYKWNLLRIHEKYRDEFIERFQRTFKQYYGNNEIKNNCYMKNSVKTEIEQLINDKKSYRKFIDKLSRKKQLKENRREQFSLRINPSRISLILFGKHILEIG